MDVIIALTAALLLYRRFPDFIFWLKTDRASVEIPHGEMRITLRYRAPRLLRWEELVLPRIEACLLQRFEAEGIRSVSGHDRLNGIYYEFEAELALETQ